MFENLLEKNLSGIDEKKKRYKWRKSTERKKKRWIEGSMYVDIFLIPVVPSILEEQFYVFNQIQTFL